MLFGPCNLAALVSPDALICRSLERSTTVGKNSRERHKAKQKAAQAQQRRREAAHDAFGLLAASDVPAQRDLVEAIITDAVFSRHDRRTADFEQSRKLLVDGPGGLAGLQLVNRTLLAVLQRDARQCWERGWQPAELVRMAHREHTARHARLMTDTITAQMRVYAPATVDPHWQAQLAGLGSLNWWEHDDLFVDSWAAQHGVDRMTAVDHVVDVLHLLRTLPSIESVGPLPGAFRPSRSTSVEVDQRMLDRIRALLAKAESTDYPQEAEAFTEKAQQLMARHSIDHALLAAKAGGKATPTTRRVAIDNPYEAPKTLLLQVVAEANRCRAVWMKRYGLSSVVGFSADLDATEVLFTSLLVQATKAMTQQNPRADRFGRNTTRSFRQSFLAAYANRIGERLNAATSDVDKEMATSDQGANLLPVLAARSNAVQSVFESQFPMLSSHETPATNRDGWVSGRAAADRAALHGHREVAN